MFNPHIWKSTPNYPMNIRGLAIDIARQNGGMISREMIDAHFTRIKVGIPNNQALISRNELLFCDKAKFMPIDCVNLSAERCGVISKALDGLFASENASYVILRDIREDWFLCLPELPSGTNWTPLLLQEVLRVRTDLDYRPIAPSLMPR